MKQAGIKASIVIALESEVGIYAKKEISRT